MQLINTFMVDMLARLQGALEASREEGQTLVEYALIIALMSITLVGVLGLLSGGVGGVFTDIIAQLGGGS